MDVPRDDKLDLLDDWTGVAEAIDAVQSGGFAATAATAVHQIDEVVFTSPTDDIDAHGGGTTRLPGFLGDETAAVQLVTWWGRTETDLGGITFTPARFAEVTIVPRDVGTVFFEVEGSDGEPVSVS